MSQKKDEPILQWQDGIGNIPVFQDEGSPQFNPTINVDEDDVIWALGVALMVVMIAGSLCLLVKCNANMLNRRKKEKSSCCREAKKHEEGETRGCSGGG